MTRRERVHVLHSKRESLQPTKRGTSYRDFTVTDFVISDPSVALKLGFAAGRMARRGCLTVIAGGRPFASEDGLTERIDALMSPCALRGVERLN